MKLYKSIFKENIQDDWTKDIFSKKVIKQYVAIFLNKTTNTMFASEPYSDKIIKYVISDVEKESEKKLSHIKTIPLNVFQSKYKILKEIPQIQLSIVSEK